MATPVPTALLSLTSRILSWKIGRLLSEAFLSSSADILLLHSLVAFHLRGDEFAAMFSFYLHCNELFYIIP